MKESEQFIILESWQRFMDWTQDSAFSATGAFPSCGKTSLRLDGWNTVGIDRQKCDTKF